MHFMIVCHKCLIVKSYRVYGGMVGVIDREISSQEGRPEYAALQVIHSVTLFLVRVTPSFRRNVCLVINGRCPTVL